MKRFVASESQATLFPELLRVQGSPKAAGVAAIYALVNATITCSGVTASDTNSGASTAYASLAVSDLS